MHQNQLKLFTTMLKCTLVVIQRGLNYTPENDDGVLSAEILLEAIKDEN